MSGKPGRSYEGLLTSHPILRDSRQACIQLPFFLLYIISPESSPWMEPPAFRVVLPTSVNPVKKIPYWGMVMHNFSSSTQEAEADRSLVCSKLA